MTSIWKGIWRSTGALQEPWFQGRPGIFLILVMRVMRCVSGEGMNHRRPISKWKH